MKTPKKVTLFQNGNSIAFDENGEQVPECQINYIIMYLKHIESLGIDPMEIESIEIAAIGRYVQPIKLESGEWNYKIVAF